MHFYLLIKIENLLPQKVFAISTKFSGFESIYVPYLVNDGKRWNTLTMNVDQEVLYKIGNYLVKYQSKNFTLNSLFFLI